MSFIPLPDIPLPFITNGAKKEGRGMIGKGRKKNRLGITPCCLLP